MYSKAFTLLKFTVLAILGMYFLFEGLVIAKGFLIPVVIAGLLAMMLSPLVQRLERWGIRRPWGILTADLLTLGFIVGLTFIIGSEVKSIAGDWPQIEERMQPKIEQLQHYIEEKTGLSPTEQKDKLKQSLGSSDQSQAQKGDESAGGPAGFSVGRLLFKTMNIVANLLLTLVYIFFFMLYKEKFKKSILKFIPKDQHQKAREVITESSKISQQYLLGRFLLILFLSVFYSVGLGISGVKHAIFISVLSAVLSLLPYIGNMIGATLAVAMSFLTSGETGPIIGVAITFSLVQFIETYILEPYVLGDRVNLNPVLTIVGVVLGGAVWGSVGMILSIPIMGILKVIFDHVPVLQPIGYFLGEEDTSSGDGGQSWFKKIKRKWLEKSRAGK